MNAQNDQPRISAAAVACATCDNIFLMHAGRPTCPACGGEPRLMLLDASDLMPGPQEASEEGETAQDVSGNEPPAEPSAPTAPEPPAAEEAGNDSPSAPDSSADPVEA